MISARKTGWIGVDIGTSTVKVAQLVRDHQQWRLAAASIVPRRDTWPAEWTDESPALSSLDEMKASQSLQGDFRGNRVAATLPMTLCDVHTLDRSLEGDPHADDAVRQAIEIAIQRPADDLQFDFWSTSQAAGDGRGGWTNVLTVPRNWSDQLSSDIAQSGWSCETIDGLPFALARAVNLVCGDHSDAPIAALDWGVNRATLCVIVAGIPTYVRSLKNCGFRRVVDALTEGLEVTSAQAQQLLEEHGLSHPRGEDASEASQLIQELVAEPLAQVADEIRRSISHFEYQRRSPAPRAIYLLGGGATIKHLPRILTSALGVPAHRWHLGDDASDGPDASCLFGAAAALSALAWEAS